MAKNKYEIQLDSGEILQFDYEPTDKQIESILYEIKGQSLKEPNTVAASRTNQALATISLPIPTQYPSLPKTDQQSLASQSLGMVKDIGMKTLMPKFLSEPVQTLESSGKKVKEEVKNITGAPNMIMGMLPFTPSEFSTEIGSSLLPTLPLSGKGTKISKTIANAFVGTPSKLLQRDIRRGATTLGERILNKGLSGSREDVALISAKRIDELEKGIKNIISNVSKEEDTSKFTAISKEKIATVFDVLKKEYSKTGLNNSEVRKIDNLKGQFLKSHGDDTSIKYWNDVKRKLYEQIGDRGYLTKTPSAKIEVEKSVARKIREEIEKIIPEIKKLNREQGDYIEIRDALNNTIAKNSQSIRQNLIGDISENLFLRGARTIAPQGKGQIISPIIRSLPLPIIESIQR